MFFTIPILFGVNLITFSLFFIVNTPDDIARIHLGDKYTTEVEIANWKKNHGYHLPLFYNKENRSFKETIFFQQSIKLFSFNYGISDTGRNIAHDLSSRYKPSIMLALPSLIIGLWLNVLFAMFMAFFKNSYIDVISITICVVMMSVSVIFYIISCQLLFSKVLKWVPISGYLTGASATKFIILPLLVSVLTGLGSGARWYRTFFIDELYKDYVLTCKAKGLNNSIILFKHVLKNAIIPILTGIVVILPLLFMGSLVLESFFAIPGLGSYTIDAIRAQDFAIVKTMVFLGSILYILGLLLTDITYIIVDPRIKLG